MTLLTVEQVAAQLQVDGSTVYRLVAQKQIVAVRWIPRGPIRFRQEDVDAFIAQHRQAAAEPDTHAVARAALRDVMPAARRF